MTRPVLLAGALAALLSTRPDHGTLPRDVRFDLAISEVGRFNFYGGDHPDPRMVAAELGGLDRIEEDRYVAVGDEHATLHFMRIAVDPSSGRVLAAEIGDPTRLTDLSGTPLPEPDWGPDRESVAYDPASDTVWIANERTGADRRRPSLARHSLAGRTLEIVGPGSHPSLAPFAHARPNLGFESLTRRADGSGWWAANEEALTVDGPTATTERGSVVRLVSFDPEMRPLAQYAYVTDAVPGTIRSPLPAVGADLSGVVELLALPGGALLALERALGGDDAGMAFFRLRIYRVLLEGATDVSSEAYREGLAGARYSPAAKTLLRELRLGLFNSNFEAMALGPELADGDRSLLLLADNGGGIRQSIYALRISGLPAAGRR